VLEVIESVDGNLVLSWSLVVADVPKPVTIYELLAGVAESDDAHFIESRKAIQVLYPTGPKSFLDLLSVFVPNTIFGEQRKTAASVDTDFDLWIEAVLRSSDRETLQSEKPRVGLRGRSGLGLDLDSIRRSIRDFQAGCAKLFRLLRKAGASELTRSVWAKKILRDLGKPQGRSFFSLASRLRKER
jgi:hypothetical protein